jgi:pimeloyl-ACP methyl ester carboxylesterase
VAKVIKIQGRLRAKSPGVCQELWFAHSYYHSWSAYRSEEIVNDIRTLLETRYQSQSMVIIAHSFGCSIATYLAGSQSLSSCIKGLVLIAPKATIDEKQKKGIRILRWIPDWLFDGLRVADRKGGLESKSVSRMLGSTADKSLKRR